MYTQYYIYIYTHTTYCILPPRRGLWIVRASRSSAPRTGNSTLCSPWRGGVAVRTALEMMWIWLEKPWKILENHGKITENHGTYGKKDGTEYRKIWENPGNIWENYVKTPEHYGTMEVCTQENRGKSWKLCSSNPFLHVFFFGMCFHFWFWYVLVIKFQTISSPSTRF